MKRRGIISVGVVLMGIFFLTVFAGGLYGGAHMVQNIKTSSLILQCDAIDRSLELWSKNHKGVDEASITSDSNGKIKYSGKRFYPETLDELGEVQMMGYFSRGSIDLSQFTYSTIDNGTQYKLEVTLPNGSRYTSIRSNT